MPQSPSNQLITYNPHTPYTSKDDTVANSPNKLKDQFEVSMEELIPVLHKAASVQQGIVGFIYSIADSCQDPLLLI
jgi:hypothetical protein